MLFTQTLEKLHALRLEGLVEALEEQRRQTDIVQLDFEERLALLVERQWLCGSPAPRTICNVGWCAACNTVEPATSCVTT
jgi:hypothetical protein